MENIDKKIKNLTEGDRKVLSVLGNPDLYKTGFVINKNIAALLDIDVMLDKGGKEAAILLLARMQSKFVADTTSLINQILDIDDYDYMEKGGE